MNLFLIQQQDQTSWGEIAYYFLGYTDSTRCSSDQTASYHFKNLAVHSKRTIPEPKEFEGNFFSIDVIRH